MLGPNQTSSLNQLPETWPPVCVMTAFTPAPIPDTETLRLATLASYSVMDSPPEDAFDDFTQLASQLLGAPIALISLLDESRQWFKSKVGLDADETPRDWAFCSHAILQPDVMIVEDAKRDVRFAGNPLVVGEPHIRFYAGCPLVSSDGHALGTLCVIDHEPRKLSEAQVGTLRRLGRQLVNLLELRRTTLRQRETELRLREQRLQLQKLALVTQRTNNVVIMADPEGRITWVNKAFEQITGFALDEAVGRTPGSLLQFAGTSSHEREILRDAVMQRKAARVHILNRGKHGNVYWMDVDLQPLHDEQEGFLGFVAVETDITDLIRQRDHLDAMFEALPVGFVQLGPDLSIQRSNRLAQHLLDRPLSAQGSQLPVQINSMIRDTLHETRGIGRQLVVVPDLHGHARWLQMTTALLPGTLGQPEGVLLALEDHTEQVQLGQYMELACATADLCHWHWHLTQQRLEVSDLWRQRLGDAHKGLLPTGLLHPDDRKRALREFRGLMREGRSAFKFECRIRFGDGGWRWVLCGGAVTQRNSRGDAVTLSGILLDIDERKRMEQALELAATTDSLTRLPNRVVLKDRLQQALAAAHRHGRHGALLFLDLDHFKRVNDSHGHSVGDELLRAVAERLQSQLRACDTLARTGGDEMLVLLPELAESAAEAQKLGGVIAEKLQRVLDEPIVVRSNALRIGMSVGVTFFPKGASESVEDLIREADTAMYAAKGDSRGSWRQYEFSMHQNVSRRLRLDNDLRLALDREEFQLHIQGKWTAKGELAGGEVLLRWMHPEKGSISPADFIPAAEESELIVPLGAWVLTKACQIAREVRESIPGFVTSVNISPLQIRQPGFADGLRSAVSLAGLRPDALIMEITEGVLLQPELAQQLVALEAEGFRFSIDDFGTGYSSLAYLKRLPVHELKIDRSFVRDLEDDADDAALVQAILSIARRFGIRTVAEGVETQAQARFLHSSGCDLLQGYLFDRPRPVDSFMQALVRGGSSQPAALARPLA
jgi:diguanylate cyclase (GGDEF)-like protein/PAS domain S-box-containing protein